MDIERYLEVNLQSPNKMLADEVTGETEPSLLWGLIENLVESESDTQKVVVREPERTGRDAVDNNTHSGTKLLLIAERICRIQFGIGSGGFLQKFKQYIGPIIHVEASDTRVYRSGFFRLNSEKSA